MIVHEYKVGDKVECHDAKGTHAQLAKGQLYTIDVATESTEQLVGLCGVKGLWRTCRFHPVANFAAPTGVKFDGDKPRLDLLTAGMPDALIEIAKVLTFGSKKYADHNWKIVPAGEKRYAAAAMRHFLANQSGELTDAETGLSHLAHMACCVLFLLQKELEGEQTTK